MMRKVTEDEIVGAWLKTEISQNWNLVRQYLNSSIKDNYILKLIRNPDYSNTSENRLRLKLLLAFRSSLLLSVIGAKWIENDLDESEFKRLKVINEAGWNIVSNFSGDLSEVAKNIDETKRWQNNPHILYSINKVHEKEREVDIDNLHGKLFLIKSEDSVHTTILEGNKKAIALYRKCYLKRNLNYEPIRVFVGFLKSKSFWQW